MKKFILILLLFIAGCATQPGSIPPIPKPAPMPCEMKVKNECRTMSSSEQAGAGSRGHSNNTEEPQ